MYKKYFKRLMDIVLSLIGLIVTLPIFIIIAILIKLTSKGNIFFLQERLGLNGKVFKIIKFRTMVTNAEKIGDGLKVKTEKDNRITKIGGFLRKTSLDELPQLINVIKGDMSIVGPRPPVTYHPFKYSDYSEVQKTRFKVKPGITGLAQVKVRNNATWDERITIDNEYISDINFVKDIIIMYKTVETVVKKDGIYKTKQKGNLENVTIRKFESSDIENKVKWVNDKANNKYLHYDLPLEYEKTLVWFEKNKNATNRYDAVIEYNNKPVGLIGLLGIDSKNSKAEYYVLLGESDCQGKGIASKATKLLLKCAFDELKLNKIYAYVEKDNLASNILLQKNNFKQEGLLRNDLFHNEKYVDRCLYGYIKGE